MNIFVSLYFTIMIIIPIIRLQSFYLFYDIYFVSLQSYRYVFIWFTFIFLYYC